MGEKHVDYGNVKRLRVIRPFDPWKNPLCTCPPKYSLHPYTGCSHYCLYCYATSYIGRKKSRPKDGLVINVLHDLNYINKNLYVELSTSSDPYPPEEEYYLITRKVLEILASHGIRVLITTKSDLVVRDIDLLKKMNVAVMITITTIDDELSKKIEPLAPPSSRRIEAIKKLTQAGIPVGVRIDPIIPGLNDDPYDIEELIARIAEYGGKHIVTSTYKLRRDNFKRMIDAFPDMKDKWFKLYRVEKEKFLGYVYLPKHVRIKLLNPVVKNARKYGLTYATCREGLVSREFFNAPSCDGSHLINRVFRSGKS